MSKSRRIGDKKMLVSVRFAVEVRVPRLHFYATDEEYAEACALRRVKSGDEDALAVEVVA